MTTATQTRYRIESRIPGQTTWEPEGSGDTFDTEAAAEAAVETLETENEDGDELEYRVVEVMRRESLPPPGPSAIHYEVMPDGSAPVRLTFTVLAF